jgi:NAD(P)-dependent dehydrogenase (short-subunit alcohol dehydrogenase family)
LANGRQSAAKATNLAIKSFGQLDGVVINHGVLSPISRLEHASIEDWKKLYDVNLFSALALASPCAQDTGESRH